MKIDNELKKDLLDFLWWHDMHAGFELDPDKQEEIVDEYLKSKKDLALGKPRPLAKNKQFDDVCNHEWERLNIGVERCIKCGKTLHF